MSVKVSFAARADVDKIIDHYLREASQGVADAFIDAWQVVQALLTEHPEVGSLRLERLLDRRGLRVWQAGRFPYLILYNSVDGVAHDHRVVHAARDIHHAWNE